MSHLYSKWFVKAHLFSSDKFCASSVANLSVLLLYMFTVFYSYFVYQHINFFEIVYVSLLYLVFLVAAASLFKFEVFRFSINRLNVFLCLILTGFLIILITTPLKVYHVDYFRTFPLLEADLGLGTTLRGWYDDTVFHVSIIQSILNFGYPSIGQHDSPLMIYHVATHYFDALIIFLTGLDPFDSYTLNSIFKRFVYLSALLLFVARVVKVNMWLFLLSIFIFIPVSVGTWHSVISHGLWLPSVIFILSAPVVFNLIITNRSLSLPSLLFLFSLIIIISLGKVSLGFMFASFIGFVLFLKRPNDFKVYYLGALWLIFFYFYSEQMPIDTSVNSDLNLKNLSFSTLYDFLISPPILENSIIAFCLFALCSYLYRSKDCYKLGISSAAIILVAYIICYSMEGLAPAHKFYFKMATSSIILTFAFISFVHHVFISNKKVGEVLSHISNERRLLLIFGFISLTSFLLFNVFNMGPRSLLENARYRNNVPFQVINASSKNNLSITESILTPSLRGSWYTREGVFSKFKSNLDAMLRSHNIDRRDALMFIPSEVYSQLPHGYGNKWAAGMFIYAVMGVPLLNALTDEQVRGYGIYSYGSEGRRIKRKDFDLKSKCIEHEAQNIIIVESIAPQQMTLNKCDSNSPIVKL